MTWAHVGKMGYAALRSRPDRRSKTIDAAFLIFTAYLCHLVFFSIFGIGWTVGWGSNAKPLVGVSMPWRHASLRWGAELAYVRAGQAVRVHYAATLAKGGLRARLYQRYRPGAPSAHSDTILQSGSGIVEVHAPADGWYAVSMHSQPVLTAQQMADRPLFGPREETTSNRYWVRWRVVD